MNSKKLAELGIAESELQILRTRFSQAAPNTDHSEAYRIAIVRAEKGRDATVSNLTDAVAADC
jgi:hypothetical protein